MKLLLKLLLRGIWILTSLVLAWDVVHMTYRLWGLIAALCSILLLPLAAVVVTVVHLWNHAWAGPIEIWTLFLVTVIVRRFEENLPWRPSPNTPAENTR